MKSIMKIQFKKNLLLPISIMSLILASCSSEDDGPGTSVSVAPIELDCSVFEEDLVLTDNPDAPIDYIISCYAAVEKKLTIEPGVVVHFTEHAGLDFKSQSSIHAVGTPDKPIVMTGTELVPGWWKGLVFVSGSNTNIMEHVDVSYGGSQIVNGDGPTSVVVYSGGALTMKNSTIKHSEKSAFDARYRDSKVTLENNTFTENIQPLNISLQLVHKASATNDFSGNELDIVHIISNPSAIEESVVWQNINVPYRVTGHVNVSRLGSLTIEPGTIIEMGPGALFDINEGGFKMVGTQALPIVVRGVQSGPGSWKGIGIGSINPMNEIGFAKISDAGQDPENSKGAVSLWFDTKLNIHDTDFKDLASCGVYGLLKVGQSENPNYSSSNLTFDNTPCTEFFERG